jgi:hypothetical protein
MTAATACRTCGTEPREVRDFATAAVHPLRSSRLSARGRGFESRHPDSKGLVAGLVSRLCRLLQRTGYVFLVSFTVAVGN